MSGRGFPWEAALALGLGTLRMAPAAFWALTPRELLFLAGPPAAAPPTRDALNALIQRFPDQGRSHG